MPQEGFQNQDPKMIASMRMRPKNAVPEKKVPENKWTTEVPIGATPMKAFEILNKAFDAINEDEEIGTEIKLAEMDDLRGKINHWIRIAEDALNGDEDMGNGTAVKIESEFEEQEVIESIKNLEDLDKKISNFQNHFQN
jgi:hypothetical protein